MSVYRPYLERRGYLQHMIDVSDIHLAKSFDEPDFLYKPLLPELHVRKGAYKYAKVAVLYCFSPDEILIAKATAKDRNRPYIEFLPWTKDRIAAVHELEVKDYEMYINQSVYDYELIDD